MDSKFLLIVVIFCLLTLPNVLSLGAGLYPNLFGPEPSDDLYSQGAFDDEEGETGTRRKYDEESQLFLRRNTRQKTCRWLGCQKLPLGKMHCPRGTFLESYKMCEPRGSGNINIQCCP